MKVYYTVFSALVIIMHIKVFASIGQELLQHPHQNLLHLFLQDHLAVLCYHHQMVDTKMMSLNLSYEVVLVLVAVLVAVIADVKVF